MSQSFDGSEAGAPVSTFQSHSAEGDILAKQGDYRKAIDAFSKALHMRPGEKNCLVARSKCYLQLGNPDKALVDAETALKEENTFFKGIYQKAEALYAKGDFELALVFFHRGNNLRPELNEFRLGIQKAREAIDNSIGNPKKYEFQEQAQTNESPDTHELLGPLFLDKEYFVEFLHDKDFQRNKNGRIMELVENGLQYLETRTEFWRQQKPIYARRKEASMVHALMASARCRQIVRDQKRFLRITRPKKQATKETTRPKKQATKETTSPEADTWAALQTAVNTKDAEKIVAVAELYISKFTDGKNMGNVYLELGLAQTDEVKAENALLRSTEYPITRTPEALSMLGRVQIRLGKYNLAIQTLLRKINTEQTNNAWAYHDIALCYKQLNDERVLEFADLACKAAIEEKDDRWILNSGMLGGKEHKDEKSKELYKTALEAAKRLNELDAIEAIEIELNK